MISYRLGLPLLAVLFASSLLLADDSSPATAQPLNWHDDYGTAYAAAKEHQRLLLIHFQAAPASA